MKEQNEILSNLFNLFDAYRKQVNSPNSKVYLAHSPNELRKKFNFFISKEGSTYKELLSAIEQYLTLSTKTGHKQFFNQLFGNENIASIMGEMTASITNTSMYTYEMAPVATLMELELIKKMCAYLNFSNGDGIFTPGGSISNLQAMLIARNKSFPNTNENGIQNYPKMIAFVSEDAHYSFDKAANVLGLGTKQLRKIKTNKQGKMIAEELEKEIEKSIRNKEKPFFIGLTTGTTIKGAFDPIEAIAPIAKKHNCWLHADGSWGGSVVISNKHKHLIKGIEKVDSFTWNPHKLMNISLSCSCLLVRKKGILEQSLSNENADYLFHENDNKYYDLGKKSLQCGRRVDALKLWLSWKYYGDVEYENRINKLFELAKYAAFKVKTNKNIELMNEPSFLNICFRWIPKIETNLNEFNLNLREQLVNSGLSMINYGFIADKLSIRLVLVNPDIDKEDIDLLFKNIERTAIELINQIKLSA